MPTVRVCSCSIIKLPDAKYAFSLSETSLYDWCTSYTPGRGGALRQANGRTDDEMDNDEMTCT